MSLPRRVLPGQVYMVQRRCAQRQFLLNPSPVVEQVFLYCLALAAQRFGVEVFCFVVLANHYHLGLVDPHAKLPRFMALLNSLVARALNVKHARGEGFWASGTYSAVALGDDPDTVLDKLVYMILNPVAASLVERPEDWPGLVSLPDELGRRELVARKPSFFFRRADDPDGHADDTAAGRARRRAPPRDVLPDEVRLRLVRPPGFDGLTDDQVRGLVAERVEAKVAELAAERRRDARQVLGAAAVLLQPVSGVPGGSAPTFGLNPRLACRDRWRRAQLAEGLVAFWREHREAATRYRAGERGVWFPEGTYWYRVHFGARCRRTAAA